MRLLKIGGEMLRHPLCIRWTDAQFDLVVDTAWKKRMRVSEMVREIVLEKLSAEGDEQVTVEMPVK